MSYATLILGESGTGKTCSLRNLDPNDCLLIQPVRKPLPFRTKGWKEITQKNDGGNIYVPSDMTRIATAMYRCAAPIVIVDDYQYVLASMFMARRTENGFQKFSDIGGIGYDIAKAASELAPDKRVYILAHTQTDENGRTKIKTIGKLLDEKITLEGMFTTVLRTFVDSGHYFFSTQNNGQDTVKSPMGMFTENLIENDLALVDQTICTYYGISNSKE